MKLCIRFVLAAMVMLAMAVSAGAARIDYAGAKPTAPLRDGYRQERLAAVIKDGSPVWKSPLSGSKKIGKEDFGKLLYIYKESAGFYLVGPVARKGKMIGWMSDEHIQIETGALQRRHLYRKALPVNDVVQGQFAQQVVFRTGPGEHYRKRMSSDIFSVWFIYREENGHYLLGAQQKWGKGGFVADQKLLAGWVPINQCYPWNSRFAINYDKSTYGKRQPAYIFEDEESIFDYYESNGKDKSGLIMKEGSEPFAYYASRMPISDLREEGGNQFFNIGVPGKIVTRAGGSGNSKLSAKYQHLYNEMRNRNQNIDILFVMDHTTSMAPYFQDTSRAIGEFVDGLDAWLAGRVKFGLATYRDYMEGRNTFQFRVNFKSDAASNVFRFKQELKKAGASCGDAKDNTPHEAVFNGLGSAVNRAQWRESSSRFVVLVGDHGDHPRDRNGWTDSVGSPSSKLFKTLSDNNISLFAVQTPNSRARAEQAYKDFKRQFSAVEKHYGYPAAFFAVGSKGKAYDLLLDTLRTITAMVKSEILAVDCARGDNPIGECLKDLAPGGDEGAGVVMKAAGHTNFMEKRLKLISKKLESMGLTFADLQKLGGSIQACENGWIAARDLKGAEQTQVEVMVDRASLNLLLTIVNIIVKDTGLNSGGDVSEMLPALLTQSVSMYAGQQFEQTEGNYAQAIRMRLGLPIRNPLLNQDAEGLRRICQDDSRKCMKLFSDLRRSSILLDSVLGEFAVDIKPNGELAMRAEMVDGVETSIQQRWWWSNNGGVIRYAWVPFSYFP